MGMDSLDEYLGYGYPFIILRCKLKASLIKKKASIIKVKGITEHLILIRCLVNNIEAG